MTHIIAARTFISGIGGSVRRLELAFAVSDVISCAFSSRFNEVTARRRDDGVIFKINDVPF